MKILVAGASGLIGTALKPLLEGEGHSVSVLSHSAQTNTPNVIMWNPLKGKLNLEDIEGFDAFINLAGENISSGRWTATKKKAILESRISATGMLCHAIGKLSSPPKIIVSASAVGYYGSQGNAILDENASRGTGFLADVCSSWESAALPAKDVGVRLVLLRFGMVLSPEGGALKKMLLPFKLGLGGRMGSGEQFMSWIALEDAVRIIVFCLNQTDAEGPMNAVAPTPITNAEFTKTLGEALSRPTFLTVPSPLVCLVFGEMGQELLLSSCRAVPKKLLELGYAFKYRELKAALEVVKQ